MRDRRLSHAPLILTAALVLVSTGLARPTAALETIVLTGDPAPGGAAEETFVDLLSASVSASGDLVFNAITQRPADPRRRGLWRVGSDGVVELILFEDEAVPGSSPPTVVGRPSGNQVIRDSGEVALWAGGTLASIDRSGQVTVLASHLGAAPGASIPTAITTECTSSYRPAPQLTSTGGVAATLDTSSYGDCSAVDGNAVLARTSTTPWTTLLSRGDPAPDLPGVSIDWVDEPQIAENGDVVFGVWLALGGDVDTFNDYAVFRWSDGALELIVREQDPLPVPGVIWPPVQLETMPVVAVSRSGEVAFSAWWWDDADEPHSGIWRVGDAGLEPVLMSGDRLPGQRRFTFADIQLRGLVGDGRPLVWATARDGFGVVPEFDGYWIQDPDGRYALLAGLGMTAPVLGEPGAVYDLIDQPVTNEAGDVVFTARIAGPTVGGSEDSVALRRPAGGYVRAIAREGDALEVAPGDVRTVFSIPIVGKGTPAPFDQGTLDERGRLILRAIFTDGSRALLRGHVGGDPAP